MSAVKVLARWSGWCDPCEIDRPLVLAEHGPRGTRAWLGGVGIEDRTLHLTCGVCGKWQLVPQLEEDDPITDAERAQIEATLRDEQERAAAEAELEVLTPSVVRMPLFGRRRATDRVTEPVTEPVSAPVAEIEDEVVETVAELDEEEAVERPSRFRFRRTPAVVTDEDEIVTAEVDEVVSDVVLGQDVVPARRSLLAGLRRTPKVEAEVTEDVVADEDVEVEVPRSIAPDEDEPLVRWSPRRTEEPAVPAIVSTALVPSRAGRPSPADIPAPRALKTTVAVPVPRTAPSPVRSISATDTALLTLLSEGLDVVSAGRR